MRNNNKGAWMLATVFLAGLITFSPASAQILWHACTPSLGFKGYYEYTALASYGNQVIVAAQIRDTTTNMWTLRFLKSEDGGQHWSEIDPGFGELAHRDDFHVVSMQDLDGKNIFAVSDSGYFIHSTNGAQSWSKSHVAPHAGCDINFADSAEGILISKADSNTFFTTDAGNSWHSKVIPMAGWAITSHAYGRGKFRVFSYGYGSIYTTKNYWQTYDTTLPLAPQTDLNHLPIACKMDLADTLYAHGSVAEGDPASFYPFIARTTNGGLTWDTLMLAADSLKTVSAISDLNRDTIIVAGEGALEYSLSYDRGKTWIRDTMISDTRFSWYVCRTVNLLASGNPIGLWRISGFAGGNAGILVGEWKNLTVETYEYYVLGTRFYPNPTAGRLSIESVAAREPVVIQDVLGRDVFRTVLDGAGKAEADLSALPRGVYSAVLIHRGNRLPIGKIALIGSR